MAPPERSIGYLAQVACVWEVLARKAGNVCPGREFADLTVNDFLVSAAAIAPILELAPHQPLGITILRAIEATRQVVNTNTNLGIVLLLAPLAAIPLDQPLEPGLDRVLQETTVDDARHVYAAIRLAKPGGLGEAPREDVHGEPTMGLREVMTLARGHDDIADQYASTFALVLQTIVPDLVRRVEKYHNVERAIVETQLRMLARRKDCLILRKAGSGTVVRRVQQLARMAMVDDTIVPEQFLACDAYLREGDHSRNPGTTADLIAAALFVALRERKIALSTPFVWENHPFQ